MYMLVVLPFLYLGGFTSKFRWGRVTLNTGIFFIWPHYPHAFFKKRRGYCNRLRPSFTLSPPKPSDEIQPNLVHELLTWMGRATAHFFGPAPWGGAKRSNIIVFILLSQFQRFLNQNLYVFSQMKDIKHIRWDFHLAAWVIPQGWDL